MAGQQQNNIISFIYITGLGCGDGLLDGAKLTQSLSVVHNVISHTRRGGGGRGDKVAFRVEIGGGWAWDI